MLQSPKFHPHHMLQPQLLQVLLGSILELFQSATSVVSIIMENVERCIAPAAIKRVTQQNIAGTIKPKISSKETTTATTATTTTTTTTTPTTATTMHDQALPAMDVERLGITVETAPTTTTPGMEEQEEC